MKIPHPIPYQGSKRNMADKILSYFPDEIETLFEPFAGSAAVTILAASKRMAKYYHINDVNRPLIELWKTIVSTPEEISKKYENLWRRQQGNQREFYDAVRTKFNKSSEPELLLYLLARCVKAAVRYNYDGEFNQSPDNRRLGRKPSAMHSDIHAISRLLQGKATFTSGDYQNAISTASVRDLVYLDPPYQGTFESGGFRYFEDVNTEKFIESLALLNSKGVPFILSYDGRTDNKSYGQALPSALRLEHIEINAGRSSQATLLGRNHITYESLYLSPNLVKRLKQNKQKAHTITEYNQTHLFAS